MTIRNIFMDSQKKVLNVRGLAIVARGDVTYGMLNVT